MKDEKIILSIINGCLLGDAHISRNRGKKENSSFNYTSSSKEHVEFIKNSLICNLFNLSEIKKREVFDIRTNKIYTNYSFYSNHNNFFTEIRNKWYPNGIKIIPKDLILDNLTNLYWYIGDGGLSQNYKGKMTNHLKLSTHCFSISDLNFIVNQLNNFNAYVNIKAHLILIPRRKIELFLDFIGNCPINDYKHKWNVFPYKNGELNYLSDLDKINIEFLYKQGLRHFEIANKLKLNKDNVSFHIKTHTDYKVKKISWILTNENGLVINTDNLSEFSRENNLGQQNLRDFADGKRIKPYKGWKCIKIKIGGHE